MNQFFQETIGLPYSTILRCFEESAPADQQATMRDVIERRITKVRRAIHLRKCLTEVFPKLMVPRIRSHWYNPPRRRRHLMKEVLQWHMLYDVMSKDVAQHRPPVRTH